jgi:ferrous iron transport protein A
MNSEDNRVSAWRNRQQFNWKKFLFFYNSGDSREEVNETGLSPDGSMYSLLAMTQAGDRVCIVALNCGEANSRLMGMGLMPGIQLEIVSCSASGSVIVALQDQRFGLDADMTRQIQVRSVQTQSGKAQSIDSTIRNTAMNSNSTPSVGKLRNATVGSVLKVVGYEPTVRDYKRKLLAMGLTVGTQLIVTRHAPLGDPTEIEVRGFHLSLRKDEADALRVEPID